VNDHALPSAAADHPTWCRPDACEAPGLHLGDVTTVDAAGDDALVHVRAALWDAEPGFPAVPGVRLEVTSTVFLDPAQRAFLSPDEAAQVALALLSTGAKAGQCG
jgi:hypothetical protein